MFWLPTIGSPSKSGKLLASSDSIRYRPRFSEIRQSGVVDPSEALPLSVAGSVSTWVTDRLMQSAMESAAGARKRSNNPMEEALVTSRQVFAYDWLKGEFD